MLYIEYLGNKVKYENAKKNYNRILDEKTKIFDKTQPSAIKTETEKVDGGTKENKFDRYIEEIEEKEIDKKLEEADKILKARRIILKISEEDLINSKEIYDRIYVLRFLEKKRIDEIVKETNYSDTQIKRFIKQIKKNIYKK